MSDSEDDRAGGYRGNNEAGSKAAQLLTQLSAKITETLATSADAKMDVTSVETQVVSDFFLRVTASLSPDITRNKPSLIV